MLNSNGNNSLLELIDGLNGIATREKDNAISFNRDPINRLVHMLITPTTAKLLSYRTVDNFCHEVRGPT